MKIKEFTKSLQQKNNTELFKALHIALSNENNTEPEFVEAIINALNSRKLDLDEQKTMNNILNGVFEEKQKPTKPQTTQEKAEEIIDNINHNKKSDKYFALKTTSTILSFLGFALIATGLIAAIVQMTTGAFISALFTFLASAASSAILYAISY